MFYYCNHKNHNISTTNWGFGSWLDSRCFGGPKYIQRTRISSPWYLIPLANKTALYIPWIIFFYLLMFLDKKLPYPIQGLDLYPSPFISPTIGTNGTCIPQVRLEEYQNSNVQKRTMCREWFFLCFFYRTRSHVIGATLSKYWMIFQKSWTYRTESCTSLTKR